NCLSVFVGIALAMTGTIAYIPEMVMTFLKKVGDLATPLSLIYIGALAGSSGLVSLLKEKTAFELSIIKMIGLPLLAALILFVVPAGADAKSAFLLAAALPAAVVVPMMVEQYGYGEKLSSDIVLWSTLISMVTMPLCVWIAGILY
ncbi:MAG: AEC family transporter, partial [Anaerotignum sp.]|nr:AEC family transporter [Anaerotignum sp.]